jgi:hypothetical protein
MGTFVCVCNKTDNLYRTIGLVVLHCYSRREEEIGRTVSQSGINSAL